MTECLLWHLGVAAALWVHLFVKIEDFPIGFVESLIKHTDSILERTAVLTANLAIHKPRLFGRQKLLLSPLFVPVGFTLDVEITTHGFRYLGLSQKGTPRSGEVVTSGALGELLFVPSRVKV